jgi:hypothetical protein
MGVKSARIQQVVAGDDALFQHTIVGAAVKGPNQTVDLVPVNVGDVVTAIYNVIPQPDPNLPPNAPISVIGTVVGAYPGSVFTFPIPKGTAAGQSGLLIPAPGQTVRIEIVRTGTLKLETYYLYDEYDVIARGFPNAPAGLCLP